MEDLSAKLIDYAYAYGPNILYAIVILIVGRILTGLITGIVRRLMNRSKVDPTLTNFISSLTKVLLMTFVIIAAINKLGIQTTSLIAIIGAAGLAVGLALQGSLGNFASGVMIIIFRPFNVGDYVEAGGTAGSVEQVGIFTTIFKTPDNKKVIVPNGQITSGNITNYSANDSRRVDMVFGIGYGDDIKKAKDTLERLLREDDRVLKEPAPMVAVSELGDSSVNFVVRPWVKTADYWSVYFDFHEKVKLTFDQEGISIPFPQRDIHMYQEAASA